ncbi:NAD(P)H-dependent flavin oxidoreductase [Halalkalibacter nanhaiisediminis]|uniref:Probable nitronate monooxygenase n=1 Tax=Halalkalibacter nanhaiisediminis TaxID=688079 RepID=A0A562QH73_9BACI|nr:nitronate monooxygenase [Halalkalibacter nanhaiisediminis]TWI56122.1 nitronate monooxygenase [Halalkalibacter nanhaiisediminis]
MKQHLAEPVLAEMTLPVIAAPMFLVSSPQLVIEACKGGIIGSFPLLNARTNEVLIEWIEQIKQELAVAKEKDPERKIAPWAVNFISHRTNKRYDVDLELIKQYQPPIVITSLGHPGNVVDIVHKYGGLVFSDVSNLKHAKKAAQTGVDGLILVCGGAGGHAGTINPLAFMGAVKQFWDGITILSGCISNGKDILAAKALGADFAYMGTRFIATSESLAADEYKKMLIDSTLDDLIYTDAISGVNANYLIPSLENRGIDPTKLEKKAEVDLSHMSDAKAWKHLWSAGQGVTTIEEITPIADVIADLKQEYEDALSNICSK